MRKLLPVIALLFAAACGDSLHAQGPGTNLGFLPFGFYQPYGIRYSTSVRTPPYFAVNPPVYYGSRYARPYGESPFASPPLLSAPSDYHVRPAAQFISPPAAPGPVRCNPYVQELPLPDGEEAEGGVTIFSEDDITWVPDERLEISEPLVGPIRSNPSASADTVARRVSRPHR